MEPRPTSERKALDVPQPRERDEGRDGRNNGLDTGPADEQVTEPRAALPADAPAFTDVIRRPPLVRRVRARLVRLRPRWRTRPLAGSAALRRQWRRFALAGVLALLLIGLVAVIVHQLTPEPRFAAVRQGNLALAYSAPGSVESVVYDVSFTTPGTVAEIDVEVGQQVKAGQPLAKLDTKAAQDTLNEAQLAVTNAQTALQDAQASQAGISAQSDAELADASNQERSAMAACGTNGVCQQRARGALAAAQARAQSANAAAQAAVDAAQSQLALAQAHVRTAQDALDGATLKAPHDGTVAAVLGSAGGTAGGAGQPFIRLADLGTLQVRAEVGVADVAAIQKGQVARFTVPALPGRQFHGTVAGVSPIGDAQSGTLRYPVKIVVDMASVGDAAPLPGMAANVQIVAAQRFGVLLIPAEAVAFAQAAGDPQRGGFLTKRQVADAQARAQQLLDAARAANGGQLASASAGYVLERDAHNAWVVKPVVLGLSDGASYEVLAGLGRGEQVVTGQSNNTVTIPTPTPRPTR